MVDKAVLGIVGPIGLMMLAALGVGLGGLSWAPMVCMGLCGPSIAIPLIRDASASAALSFVWPIYALVACAVALVATPLVIPGESQLQTTGWLVGFVAIVFIAIQLYMGWKTTRQSSDSSDLIE